MWLYVALVVVIAILLVFLRGLTSRPREEIRIPPGPNPTDEEHGNLPEIAQAGSLHGFLQLLHDRYGKIASFYMGRERYYSIASPDLLKEHSKLYNRPPQMIGNLEPIYGREGIGYALDDDWKGRRNRYDRLYTWDTIKRYYNTFQRTSDEVVAKLLQHPKEEHVPLSEYMFAIAIRGMTRTSFGVTFDNDDEVHKLATSYEMAMSELERRLSHDVPSPDSPEQKQLDKGLTGIWDVMRTAIQHRKDNPPEDDEELLIDVIMRTGQSERQILSDCVTYLVAGLHTSGYLLTWAVYYIASHPEVEEKAITEINEVLGDDRVLSSNFHLLVYIRQILDETMRCAVLAPYAGRFDYSDWKLGGYTIPANTPVIHAIGVMEQDEEEWPEPTKFDPDRFAPDIVEERHPFAFEPFGTGKRKCPGHRFAYTDCTVALVTLLRNIRFRLVEGQEVVHAYRFVTRPRDEVWVTVERRN